MNSQDRMPRILGGIVIIALGTLWLVSNIFPDTKINWQYIWPLFILVPGILVLVRSLLEGRKPGSMIPGVVLLGIAATFYINIIGQDVFKLQGIWAYTTFLYPATIAFAFWAAWLLGNKDLRFLIPAVILSMLTFLILCATLGLAALGGQTGQTVEKIVWPLIIICLGSFVLISPWWAMVVKDKSTFMGKNKGEWESWGKQFGKNMERWGKDMGKNVQTEQPKSEPGNDIQEAELIDDTPNNQ